MKEEEKKKEGYLCAQEMAVAVVPCSVGTTIGGGTATRLFGSLLDASIAALDDGGSRFSFLRNLSKVVHWHEEGAPDDKLPNSAGPLANSSRLNLNPREQSQQQQRSFPVPAPVRSVKGPFQDGRPPVPPDSSFSSSSSSSSFSSSFSEWDHLPLVQLTTRGRCCEQIGTGTLCLHTRTGVCALELCTWLNTKQLAVSAMSRDIALLLSRIDAALTPATAVSASATDATFHEARVNGTIGWRARCEPFPVSLAAGLVVSHLK
jgi:hypothetical protein